MFQATTDLSAFSTADLISDGIGLRSLLGQLDDQARPAARRHLQAITNELRSRGAL